MIQYLFFLNSSTNVFLVNTTLRQRVMTSHARLVRNNKLYTSSRSSTFLSYFEQLTATLGLRVIYPLCLARVHHVHHS